MGQTESNRVLQIMEPTTCSSNYVSYMEQTESNRVFKITGHARSNRVFKITGHARSIRVFEIKWKTSRNWVFQIIHELLYWAHRPFRSQDELNPTGRYRSRDELEPTGRFRSRDELEPTGRFRSRNATEATGCRVFPRSPFPMLYLFRNFQLLQMDVNKILKSTEQFCIRFRFRLNIRAQILLVLHIAELQAWHHKSAECMKLGSQIPLWKWLWRDFAEGITPLSRTPWCAWHR